MKLEQWLTQQGLLQKAFARQMGISTATVSMLISGKRLPSPSLARDIEKHTKGKVRMKDWDWPQIRTASTALRAAE